MRLLIVSHTPHARRGGMLVGWGPTVREIDALARLFDQVVHVAPVHPGPAPESELAYEAKNVTVVSVPPAGGTSWSQKLGVLAVLPRYAAEIWRRLGDCDVVHVRCPANIALVALLLLWIRRRPAIRWVKYAGNWQADASRPWSYALQRWLLVKDIPRAVVTVNGRWSDQPPHVRAFQNPCLTEDELREGARVGTTKSLGGPMRLLFVGRLDDQKGGGRALEVLSRLRQSGVDARLEIVGDGPSRARLEAQAAGAGLREHVGFRGWRPRSELAEFYSAAHILLFPSASEGWPKVLSEGMAFGVVPLAGAVSGIPTILESAKCGRALDPNDVQAFTNAVMAYGADGQAWKAESINGIKAAAAFTYDAYLVSVRQLLRGIAS